MNIAHQHAPDEHTVVSPFGNHETTQPQRKRGPGVWMAFLIFTVLVCIVAGGFFVMRVLNDPYRTLETFPVATYFSGFKPLLGSRFKAELKVDADLGWKEESGRLMLFAPAGDSRPLAVIVPPDVARGIYFTKGQTYEAQIEVKEGGLVYASACRKL